LIQLLQCAAQLDVDLPPGLHRHLNILPSLCAESLGKLLTCGSVKRQGQLDLLGS
jgi:hypothetical protein